METLRLKRVGKNRMGNSIFKDENGRYYLDIDSSNGNPSVLYHCIPSDDMDGEPLAPLKSKFKITNPFTDKEIRMKQYEHEYFMLSRLSQECEAFFGKTGDERKDSIDCRYRNERNIWGINIHAQIEEMKRLWNVFPCDIKPQWCTWSDIAEYEQKAKNL